MLKPTIFLVLFFHAVFAAIPNPVFTISLEKPFGYAWYDLQHSGGDTTINGQIVSPTVRSELDFPVDHFRLALGLASFRSATADLYPYFRTDIFFWCAVSPSFSRMRDRDWFGTKVSGSIGNSQALVKVSDTYSSTKAFLLGGEVNRELAEIHLLGAPIVLGTGLGGSFSAYDLYGLSGNQLASDTQLISVELPSSMKVGLYYTYSIQSALNLRIENPILGIHWEARLHPLMFAHSYDDHILRKKKITMDCLGTGGALEASLPLKHWDRQPSPVSRLVPYLRVELDRTWGNMRQTYFGDSPDTPANETGQSISGINTTVNLWLVAVGAHMNFNL